MLGLLTAMPVLYVCNVDEAAAAGGNEFSRKVEARAKEEGAAASSSRPRSKPEIAVLSRDERSEYLDRGWLQGGRARSAHPRRLRAPASGDVLYRRAEGGAGLDGDRGHQGAAGRRRHPHAISSRASSAPRPLLTTTTSPVAAKPARVTPARCGSKARIMSSRTATSCTSASRHRCQGSVIRFQQTVISEPDPCFSIFWSTDP